MWMTPNLKLLQNDDMSDIVFQTRLIFNSI